MAPASPEMRWVQRDRSPRVGATVAMILDRGDIARVAMITCPAAPSLGMRFVHGGTVWEVTRAQDHIRGWVAQPVLSCEPASPCHRDTARRCVQGA